VFTIRKYLKVVKLSDNTRKEKAKEGVKKMKDAAQVKNMDAEELTDNLALLKEERKNKKPTCKRGECAVADKTGKALDTKEVKKKND
jgi:hypothetical protein